MVKMAKKERIEAKSLDTPEEVRTFDKGKVELVQVGGGMIGRAFFSRDGSGRNL